MLASSLPRIMYTVPPGDCASPNFTNSLFSCRRFTTTFSFAHGSVHFSASGSAGSHWMGPLSLP